MLVVLPLFKTAEMFYEENQDARRSIIKDGYVDYTIGGAEDVKAA